MTTKELITIAENLHKHGAIPSPSEMAAIARRLAVLEEEVEAGRACIDDGQLKNGFERFFWSLNIRCADKDRLDAARAATDKERANG